MLAARPGFPKKVKPLVRLGEREMAAYCVLRGIDYQVEECPMADGNRHLGYKEALNAIEVQSPGSKHAFYFGFLDKVAPALDEGAELEKEGARARAHAAARRQPARSAASAAWSSGPEGPGREGSALRGGAGAADRPEGPALSRDPQGRE